MSLPQLEHSAEQELRRAYSAGPRALRRSWFLAVVLGETVGFCIPALVALVAFDMVPVVTLGFMVLAGAAEGLALGTAQALVLKREFLGFSRSSWMVATSAGAAVAWLIGMLPSTFHEVWKDWPTTVLVAVGGALGFLLLGTVGFAQWLVLRRHVARARTWVPANAAGWVLGLLALTAVTTPLWHEGQSRVTTVLIGILGGLVMATAMAWVTGTWLVRLVHPKTGPRPAPIGASEQEWKALGTSTDTFAVFDPPLVEDLPEPVQRWLLRAIAPGAALLTSAETESLGSIRLGRGWHPVVTRQRSSLLGGFVWGARTRRYGLPVTGFDRFTHGTAEMRWRLLRRIRLVNADGEEVSRSAAGRHAAEVFATMPAVALDRSVRWIPVDHRRATAELLLGGETQQVTVTVDPVGRLQRIDVDRWGTPPGLTYGLYRFGLTLDQELPFDGYRIPTVVTVGWHPGSDQWTEGVFLRYRVLRCAFR